jgi:uncharacterized protein (UPF0276 family)
MPLQQPATPALPSGVGVGLKAAHYAAVHGSSPRPAFLEVHAENYLHAGGPAHRHLAAIRADHRLSIHGVGLSLGGPTPPQPAQLTARRALLRRYQPDQFSEHLAWSSLDGTHFNDLLPIAYTPQTLARVVEHVCATQDALGCRILIENPATYLRFSTSSAEEPQFLTELVQRSGCGLLLDVNNIVVSAVNNGLDAGQYLRALPLHAVGEIHLAGHAERQDSHGAALLIDSHDGPVQPRTWELFRQALTLTGRLPVLIEWDNQLPDWATLMVELRRAELEMAAIHGAQHAAS